MSGCSESHLLPKGWGAKCNHKASKAGALLARALTVPEQGERGRHKDGKQVQLRVQILSKFMVMRQVQDQARKSICRLVSGSGPMRVTRVRQWSPSSSIVTRQGQGQTRKSVCRSGSRSLGSMAKHSCGWPGAQYSYDIGKDWRLMSELNWGSWAEDLEAPSKADQDH